MNRELKFRAWDKTRKIMIGRGYPNNWDNNKDEWWADVAAMQLTGIEDISKEEEYEVMQYTGIKDKNGKEIYEGDIVKFDGTRMTVEWVEDQAGFCFHQHVWQECHNVNSNCEVIGNIYEHGDLLK